MNKPAVEDEIDPFDFKSEGEGQASSASTRKPRISALESARLKTQQKEEQLRQSQRRLKALEEKQENRLMFVLGLYVLKAARLKPDIVNPMIERVLKLAEPSPYDQEFLQKLGFMKGQV